MTPLDRQSGSLRRYYRDERVTIHHGDSRDLDTPPALLVTDPPYPNNAGHFEDSIDAALDVLARSQWVEALVFWNEMERPPVDLPLVAVHIWHRTNVNGRPYEPIYHFAADGRKRRSNVMRHAAIFDGAGPGCAEYLGHPTQKPVAVMRWLIDMTGPGQVFDPFMGVGATLRAAKDGGRYAVGVDVNEDYCRIAAERMSQEVLDLAA